MSTAQKEQTTADAIGTIPPENDSASSAAVERPGDDVSRPAEEPASSEREVRFEHSLNLAALLSHLQASLLVSTYQAGKLVVVGSHQDSLSLSFHNFDRPMGVAVRPDGISVGDRNQLWRLRNAPDVATRLEPVGKYTGCYLARSAHRTGGFQAHEIAWAGDELWIVNTLFSCLCTLDDEYSFVPRWRPPFVTALAPEDRCHLNGLAMQDGRPKYVTALAQTDTAQGWRPDKVTSGCVLDIASGEPVAQGFSMPHSPRVHQGRLWLLDSGKGQLLVVDPATGQADTVAQFPGYARGLALYGSLAFVGLSKIRETSTFGGMPVAENPDELKCGVAAVDLQSGQTVSRLSFESGVDEIFDVQLLPGSRMPKVLGPYATPTASHNAKPNPTASRTATRRSGRWLTRSSVRCGSSIRPLYHMWLDTLRSDTGVILAGATATAALTTAFHWRIRCHCCRRNGL
jgi:uncharacterized protein (TIGR03032 family)